jgi:hypothetical protein
MTTPDIHTLSQSALGDLFAPPVSQPPWASEGGPWADPAPADDDIPAPPGEHLEAPPIAAADDRKRTQSATLDGLLGGLEARLAPAAVTLPPAAHLQRMVRDLPGDQRQALAARMLVEDFGIDDLAAAGYSDAYVMRLAGDSLGQRFSDALRIEPDLSPAAFLDRLAPKADPAPETANDNPFA